MNPHNIQQSLVLLVLSVILVSCAPTPIDMSKFPGEYVYRSKLGQVESLTINADGTLRDEVYDDEDSYVKQGRPLFVLDAKWANNSGWITATKLHTFLCYNTRLIKNPGPEFTDHLAFIYDYEGEGPGIVLAENEHYWLRKIKERKDIRSMKFRYH